SWKASSAPSPGLEPIPARGPERGAQAPKWISLASLMPCVVHAASPEPASPDPLWLAPSLVVAAAVPLSVLPDDDRSVDPESELPQAAAAINAPTVAAMPTALASFPM